MAEITRFTFPDPDSEIGEHLEFTVGHRIHPEIRSIRIPNESDSNTEFILYFEDKKYHDVHITDAGDVIYWIHAPRMSVHYKNQPTLPF